MNLFKRIIFKIKAFFWKRKINKIYGYKYGKVIKNYDFSSLYPHVMDSKFYYADTDSIKQKGECQ